MSAVATIDVAAVLVSVFFFSLGSYYDLKAREVDDWVWLLYAPIGGIFTVLRLLYDPSLLTYTLLSIGITALAAFALFYFGLFGGADFKAIVCLALTIPLPPTTFQPLIGYVHPVFPLVVVIQSFFCEAFAAIWLGGGNLLSYVRERGRMFAGLENESRWRKASAMILGYRTDVAKLQSSFYLYPMEQITRDEQGTRRSFKLYVNAEADRDEDVRNFCELASQSGFEGRVWVTPGLPMLVFVLIGLGLTLILGDAIFATVFILAHR